MQHRAPQNAPRRSAEPRAGGPPRPVADRLVRAFGRHVFAIFFREIRVLGADRFPVSGPVMIVANHHNSLTDGGLVVTFMPRIPRVLVASTVWQNRVVVPLLSAAGVIPIYRRAETGDAARRNRDSFGTVCDLLAAGGVVALFPEGASHHDPGLRPVKSGAARLLCRAEAERGTPPIKLLPVGLFFEEKSRFRSRLLINIGSPIETGPLVERYRRGTPVQRARAVRDLSDRISAGLGSVTPSFDSWEDARLLGRAADMWAQPEIDLPGKVDLTEAFDRRMGFQQGYAWLRAHHPDEIAAFRAEMRAYDRDLTAAGLRDEQVAARYPAGPMAARCAAIAGELLLRAPLGLAATVLNYVPYRICTAIGRRADPDKAATYALFASPVVFPLWWAGQAAAAGLGWSHLAGRPGGWPVAAGVFLAGPLVGPFALRFHDLFWRATHHLRAWWQLRRRPGPAARLRATRRRVLDHLARLVALYAARPT